MADDGIPADLVTAGVNADAAGAGGEEQQAPVIVKGSPDDIFAKTKHRQGWIFISYEDESRAMAEDTYNGLQKLGFRCWFKPKAPKSTTHDEEGHYSDVILH